MCRYSWHSAGSLRWPFSVLLKCRYILQIKYTETILSNSTRKLLWFMFVDVHVLLCTATATREFVPACTLSQHYDSCVSNMMKHTSHYPIPAGFQNMNPVHIYIPELAKGVDAVKLLGRRGLSHLRQQHNSLQFNSTRRIVRVILTQTSLTPFL